VFRIKGADAMSYEEAESLTSEFNEAKFQIGRLHNIWMECKNLREKGNLTAWKWKLDSAQIELNNDAQRLDDEKNNKQKDGKKVEGFIKALTDSDLAILLAEQKKNLGLLYNALKKKEMLIREIQEKAGKGAKYRNWDDDGM